MRGLDSPEWALALWTSLVAVGPYRTEARNIDSEISY